MSLVITFPTESGRSYTLWRSDNMAAGTSTNAGLTAIPGTGTLLTFSLPAPTPPARHFFRVQSQTP